MWEFLSTRMNASVGTKRHSCKSANWSSWLCSAAVIWAHGSGAWLMAFILWFPLNSVTGLFLNGCSSWITAQGGCYITLCKCVRICQIATEERKSVKISEREQLSVSGRWLSNEIYVSTTVFLDVKLSLKPGFVQDVSFLCCLPTMLFERRAPLKTSRNEQVAQCSQRMAQLPFFIFYNNKKKSVSASFYLCLCFWCCSYIALS